MLKEVSWMAISTLFNRVASSACSLSTIGNWRRALQQHVDVAGLADIVGLENANCFAWHNRVWPSPHNNSFR